MGLLVYLQKGVGFAEGLTRVLKVCVGRASLSSFYGAQGSYRVHALEGPLGGLMLAAFKRGSVV